MTADRVPGYRSAVENVAWITRSSRTFLRISGRSPAGMLTGLLSGSMPPEPGGESPNLSRGHVPCSVMLTPKGKMVTELRVLRLESGEAGALLLDLPGAGLPGTRSHLAKYLPPRFARIEDADPSEPIEMATLVGASAPATVAEFVLDGAILADVLEQGTEGAEWVRGGADPVGIRAIRNREVWPPAFDVIAGRSALRDLANRMTDAGVERADEAVYGTLRMERGRPAFGVEMDEDTLAPEAGIDERCIDHRKGCYTGQEVIVRIRDRGRVNRRLRGLLLGDSKPPDPGADLFHPDRGGSSGSVRSVTWSPRFDQWIGLGYVRREVEPPDEVRWGSPEGPVVGLRALDADGWVLVGDEIRSYS